VLDNQAISEIAAHIPRQGTLALVAAYDGLRTQVAASYVEISQSRLELGGIETLDSHAIRAAEVLVESEALWATMAGLYQRWSWDDNAFVEATLARSFGEFVEAEAEILGRNGLSPTAAAVLAIDAAEAPAVDGALPDPEFARRQTAVLAEELRQEQMREEAAEEREDRRFLRRWRRIGRVLHVVGGGVVLLADVGSLAATAITVPLATIGTGAVALVSIKKGSDLIRLGVDEKFARR
jgi:hypothetical protein